MHYPTFFDQVPAITLYDPLSDFLGAFEKGEMEITYLDCVKLAGHSCPTVAGAYLMARIGLERLYPETRPHRGMIKIAMRDGEADGVTGVTANVIAFIVGASGIGGFKGIKGNFSRDNLINYQIPMDGEVTLTRLDTEESVTLSYDASMVPADAMMQPLMGKSIQGVATPEEKATFGKLWQARVEKILLNPELWDQMVTIH